MSATAAQMTDDSIVYSTQIEEHIKAYLCNDITMIADVHDYNTRSSENRNFYVPKCNKELCKRSFAYQGSTLRNDLPDEVKESGSLECFKLNYRFYVGWSFSSHSTYFYCFLLPGSFEHDISLFC